MRPEQTFFRDPALDRAFGVVMALATEVYVMKERLAALEQALGRKGVLEPGLLAAEPSAAELEKSAAEREAFVAHLLQNLLGVQQAKGPSG